MPGRIRQWLRDRRTTVNRSTRGQQDEADSEEQSTGPKPPPPMPYLESQKTIGPQIRAQPNASAFFQKLPPELRHRILREAFGNRTIHIYLGLSYPILSQETSPQESQSRLAQHGGRTVPLEEWTDKPRVDHRDTSQPVGWHWWSCVCHGRDPGGRFFVQRHQDFCLHGRRGTYCSLWPGTPPNKCQIGVTGWLRACWQA